MAKYFNYFPNTPYFIGRDSTSLTNVKNIISRFTIDQRLKQNAVAYSKHRIKDGESPESLAYQLYGSAEKHWIILAMNDIVDPLFEWPLKEKNINKFIDKKYTSSANVGQTGMDWAKSNIHSYYKIITKTNSSNSISFKNKFTIDANTYTSLSSTTNNYSLSDNSTLTMNITKETKSYYDYNIELNENKREIILLKSEFVSGIEQELIRVMSNEL